MSVATPFIHYKEGSGFFPGCIEDKTGSEIEDIATPDGVPTYSRWSGTLSEVMHLWWNLESVDVECQYGVSPDVHSYSGTLSSGPAGDTGDEIAPNKRVCSSFEFSDTTENVPAYIRWSAASSTVGGVPILRNSDTGLYELIIDFVFGPSDMESRVFASYEGPYGEGSRKDISLFGKTVRAYIQDVSGSDPDVASFSATPTYYTYS